MLDLLRDHPYLSTLITMLVVAGGLMYFTGFIISLVDAWHRSVTWFIGVLLIPLVCCFYCVRYRSTMAFAGKLAIIGAIMWVPILTFYIVNSLLSAA